MDRKEILASGRYGVLENAIRAVPAVRYASGILGVVVVASLTITYLSSVRIAVEAALAVFAMMILLWIFDQCTKLPLKWTRYPSYCLVVVLIVLLAVVPLSLFTSVFFDWPKSLPQLRRSLEHSGLPSGSEQTVGSTEYAGTITDARTGAVLERVRVRLTPAGPVVAKTDSEGFYHVSVTKESSARLTLIFEADGYETITESVFPSEKLDFQMRRSD